MVYLMYHQDLTHWANPVPLGGGGTTFDAPDSSYKCRWEERVEVIQDAAGVEYISNAQVFLPFTPKVGEYVYQGISVDVDPSAVEGAREIRRADEIPDLRSLQRTTKAYL